MTHSPTYTALGAIAIVLFGSVAKADGPKEVNTQRDRPVLLENFLGNAPNCGSNAGPIPFLKLREKPSNGVVGLQVVAIDVAASDRCPARKVPGIALFYTPKKDFVGNDSVQVEFEVGDNKSPTWSFLIKVQPTEGK